MMRCESTAAQLGVEQGSPPATAEGERTERKWRWSRWSLGDRGGRRRGLHRLLGSLEVVVGVALASVACRPAAPALEPQPRRTPTTAPVTAIVGATVIDGTGAPPRVDATVLLRGRYIQAVGPRRKLRVPAGAEVIDGRGLFVLPGFIDLNVHVWGDLAREALQHGVTTVHDTWWGWKSLDTTPNPDHLSPLRALRDSIRAGDVPGPRLLFAHEILGWGPSEFGESLTTLSLDSLRARIKRYLDTGVNYVKYGATDHGTIDGVTMVFSLEAQRVIVEEAHKRGLPVEVHAQSAEATRAALLAGVDLVQHPEVLYQRAKPYNVVVPYTDELVKLFIQQGTTCALIGRPDAAPPRRPDTTVVWRIWNANRRQLIKAGCPIVPVSDAFMTREQTGVLTLHAIEDLVLLGMSPMEAIVAATRNPARVSRLLDTLGTVEAKKLADLVVLDADPLQDIKHIERIAMVFADGRRVPLVPHEHNEYGWPVVRKP